MTVSIMVEKRIFNELLTAWQASPGPHDYTRMMDDPLKIWLTEQYGVVRFDWYSDGVYELGFKDAESAVLFRLKY